MWIVAVTILVVLAYLYMVARARKYEADKAVSMNAIERGARRMPTWASSDDRLEEFFIGVGLLAARGVVPHSYVDFSLSDKKTADLVLSFAAEMERRRSSFLEQQSGAADYLTLIWKGLSNGERAQFATTTTSAQSHGDWIHGLRRWLKHETPFGSTGHLADGQLLALDTLDLGSSPEPQIQALPPELFKLAKLEKLYLQWHAIKELPHEICSLGNLRDLKLGGNRLETLPLSIGLLQNLEILSIWSNDLESLPREIGMLKNLKGLALWNNPMATLPTEITELKSLECLEMTLMPNLRLTQMQRDWLADLKRRGCEMMIDDELLDIEVKSSIHEGDGEQSRGEE